MPHSRWGEISIVQRLIVLGDYDTLSQGITMTDGAGYYTIYNVAPGSYTVTASNGAGEGTMSASVESQLAQPASDLGTVGTSLRGIPFPMVGAMGAILIIGAMMVGRLSYVARRNGRYLQ